MSALNKLLLCVAFTAALSSADGWWMDWRWYWDFEWSTQKPANCPHENPDTHVCTTLASANATCVTIKCCTDFQDDDDYAEYDDSVTTEEEENVYQLGNIANGVCSLCYTVKACSVFRCYNRCCDGYVPDIYGRCQSEGTLQCLNGGTVIRNMFGIYECQCQPAFSGKSCEIPLCRCENGGKCTVQDGRPFCSCMDGFEGQRCEIPRCSLQCANGGVCLKNGTYEVCKCPENYIGKLCERPFTQPPNCPVPEYRGICGYGCMSNDECSGNQVCCREGCSSVCREPKPDSCSRDGKLYSVGQTYSPSVCQNCTCKSTGQFVCYSVSCTPVRCASGEPAEQRPGQCCPSCPDEPVMRPPIIRCPDGVVTVVTSQGTDKAWLDTQVRDARAYDAQTYEQLQVKFRPEYVQHPRCFAPEKKVQEVQAYATDIHGQVASCPFQVTVLDKQSPIFAMCPEDIFVFEDEVVEWLEPDYKDNVGIAGKKCSSLRNGLIWDPGMYSVNYMIWDFDYNTAYCSFRVSVTRRDVAQENAPQGLMDRSTDKKHSRLVIILAPVVGGLVLIALVIAMLVCCRRHRRHPRDTRLQPPAYDNSVYADPDDVKVKLPSYNSPSFNPPAYSISGSVKDMTYISLSPPSYTNPGYETLPADQRSLVGSERSVSKKPEI